MKSEQMQMKEQYDEIWNGEKPLRGSRSRVSHFRDGRAQWSQHCPGTELNRNCRPEMCNPSQVEFRSDGGNDFGGCADGDC